MKIIYYAIKQKLEVPDNSTEAEIENFIIEKMLEQAEEPTDFVWSEKPRLFDKF